MSIVVLGGAGAMGQVIVRDLVEFSDCEVIIADYNEQKAQELKNRLQNARLASAFADVSNACQMINLLRRAKIIINASPYIHNLSVMQAALEAQCHYIDLGGLFHVTRQQLALHEQFHSKNLLAILGMGCAPGLTNIMAAKAASVLDQIMSIDIVICCVDFVKTDHPFQTPYSLDTILDEYSMEAMVFEAGQFMPMPPMSGEVTICLPEPVGTATAVYTLHSEVATLPITYKDKGIQRVTFRLGLPAEFHRRLKFLVDLGFGKNEAVAISNAQIKPRSLLAKMLDKMPHSDNPPNDCELVRVDVRGTSGGVARFLRLEAKVMSDQNWQVSSGALDTGVPPSTVAQMINHGQIKRSGVLPPEICVPCQTFITELAKRSIHVNTTIDQILPSKSLDTAAS